MAFPADCSQCGDARLRRRWPAKAQNFVPLQIGAESDGGRAGESELSSAQTRPLEIAALATKLSGVIEIEMSGARIRVEPGVDSATLSVVLSALRGIR